MYSFGTVHATNLNNLQETVESNKRYTPETKFKKIPLDTDCPPFLVCCHFTRENVSSVALKKYSEM